MFLHLGNNQVVETEEIISIHDYALFQREENRDFFARLEKSGRLIRLENEPKSLVLTEENAYFSAISSLTLKKRALQANIYEDDSKITR